jgi:hypothetical protein
MNGRAPLLHVWEHTASASADGVQPGTGERRIELDPDQWVALHQLLDQDECVALGLFLKHMRLQHTPDGPKLVVEGFTREFLTGHGMTAYSARKALASLQKTHQMLASEWAPGTQGNPTQRRWMCLAGDLFGVHTARGPVRRHRGTSGRGHIEVGAEAEVTAGVGAAPDGSSPATTHPNGPAAASGRISASPDPQAVDKTEWSSGGLSATPPPGLAEPADGGLSASPPDRPSEPADETEKAQVSTYGRVADTHLSTPPTREPVQKKVLLPPEPGKDKQYGRDDLLAFLRDEHLLAALADNPDPVHAALTDAAAAAPARTLAVLDFFGVPAGAATEQQVADLLLTLLDASPEQVVAQSLDLLGWFKQQGVALPRRHQHADVVVGTVLTTLAALDADPRDWAAWYCSGLTRSRWMASRSLRGLLRACTQTLHGVSEPAPGLSPFAKHLPARPAAPLAPGTEQAAEPVPDDEHLHRLREAVRGTAYDDEYTFTHVVLTNPGLQARLLRQTRTP